MAIDEISQQHANYIDVARNVQESIRVQECVLELWHEMLIAVISYLLYAPSFKVHSPSALIFAVLEFLNIMPAKTRFPEWDKASH
jgi:hypothetical protein